MIRIVFIIDIIENPVNINFVFYNTSFYLSNKKKVWKKVKKGSVHLINITKSVYKPIVLYHTFDLNQMVVKE